MSPTAQAAKAALGRRGEILALKYLQDRGLQLLATNFRCKRGEIDLIMHEGNTLIIVEVRTIRLNLKSEMSPLESIGRRKCLQLTKVAEEFLRRTPWQWARIRFDVIGITVKGRQASLQWLAGAFEPSDL